ncbi:MAG: hypothetical protein LQ351_002312 [Letrouitia transgressa]|nr:MAG: hypothetical protein LQ351_002312 [Letrouitia transgressa]
MSSSRDTKLLCLSRFIRLFAYGASTLILALYLSSLGVSDTRIGLFMSLTLWGDVAISFLLTLFADGLGRRRILVLGAALMTGSGLVFAFNGSYWILVTASILGVVSPRILIEGLQNLTEDSGNEIGPFKAIEESTLPQLSPTDIRSDIFAWYILLGNAGTACGTIVCGSIVQKLQSLPNWTPIKAYRMIFSIYALLGVLKLIVSLLLSPRCEPETKQGEHYEAVEMNEVDVESLIFSDTDENSAQPSSNPKTGTTLSTSDAIAKSSVLPSISPTSLAILLKLCLLFAVDSFASGLVPLSWMTYFFTTKFSLPSSALGTIFFTTSIISAISNLIASSVSKRIGLVKTMVFTHLPSAVFLSLIPIPPQAFLATTFLILRSCTQNMDQAPRQAFLAAAVLPPERTAVMGVVNVVKTMAQSGGPVATGFLAGSNRFWIAFLIAGGLKIGYDLSLMRLFVGFRGREEQERVPAPGA